jgi:hypothetical protein
MSPTRYFAFACFAALHSQRALCQTPRPGNVASLTLRNVQSSLIVLPVRINHTGPSDFIVGTGAQVTTVDSSLASELLKARGTTGVGGVATYARSAFAYLDRVEAGVFFVSNSLVVIQKLAPVEGVRSPHTRHPWVRPSTQNGPRPGDLAFSFRKPATSTYPNRYTGNRTTSSRRTRKQKATIPVAFCISLDCIP